MKTLFFAFAASANLGYISVIITICALGTLVESVVNALSITNKYSETFILKPFVYQPKCHKCRFYDDKSGIKLICAERGGA